MKQVRLLLAAIAFILLNSAPTSHAAAAENQPVLIWGRVYNSYYIFRQMQHVGGGEVVALASASNGGGKILLLKFSASGDIVWDRRFGGDIANYGNSLTCTNDGGFLICGYTTYLNGDGTNNRDSFLVKTDAAGNLQWQKSFGESGHVYEYGWFAWQREDGGYAIFGGVQDNDFFVAVTDTSGTLLTENHFSGSIPLKDVPDQDQVHYANGKPTQDGGCIIHTKTDLIKLTPQGTVEWKDDFRYLGSNPEIHDVAQTSDLGFAFIISRTRYSDGKPDSLLKKLDPEGKATWTVIISDVSPFKFHPKAVQSTSDGGFVIGGTDGQSSDGKRTVVKTDAAGTVQWSLFIPSEPGTTGIDIYSIVEQGPNQYIAAGQHTNIHIRPPDFFYGFLARIEVDPKSAARLSTMYR